MTVADELLRVVEPPEPPPSASVDWASLEGRIGTKLPNDYKWLIERYGPGSFDEFVHVLQPVTRNDAIRLEHRLERTSWTLDYLRRGGEEVPYSNDELLQAAATDNGDFIYWVRKPPEAPDSWTIVVNEARGPRWVTFKGGLVAFLAAVLSGSFTVPVFPDDFPDAQPQFEPYGA